MKNHITVFTFRTELKLEGLEDTFVLTDEADDGLSDKHGCPAYVSPEILHPPTQRYSGKASDMWSVGVMFYTMLVGRYPFHDIEPSALFGKIRIGQYALPNVLSTRAKCMIRSLLLLNPLERLTASELSLHPWFTKQGVTRANLSIREECTRTSTNNSTNGSTNSSTNGSSSNRIDQVVPNVMDMRLVPFQLVF